MDNIEALLGYLDDNRKLATENLKDTDVLIPDAFEKVAPNFKVDRAFCNRMISFYRSIFSSEHNIKWFGGCLLGTELIRFNNWERDEFFEEVLEIDEDYLAAQLERTGLNADWNVTSDTFNNACAWVLHKAYEASPGFKDKLVKEAMVALLSVWQFRFYSSLYVNQFGRNAVDMPAAEAAYAALTLKYTIKQLGSWQAAIEYRAERFLSSDSPHFKTYKDFKEINAILYIITDLSTRVRATFYGYYNELDQIRKNNARLGLYGDSVTLEGEEMIRDRSRIQDMAMRYLLNTSTSTSSFVSTEYLNVVMESVTTAPPAAVKDTLIAISNLKVGSKERETMEKVMEKTLLLTFNYVQQNQLKFTQIAYLLSKVRALITSAKTKDADVLYMRKETEKFISKYTHLRHGTTLAATRTAVLLYFIIKGLSVKKE